MDNRPLDVPQRHGELLRLARATIAHYLATGELLPYQPEDEALLVPAGVFVTLRLRPVPGREHSDPDDPEDVRGELRGCIGRIEADTSLCLVVQHTAIKAATRDPRFDPVEPEELPRLMIEISVLSPFRPVDSLDEIEIGQDGLLIAGEGRRGLLLPEVAPAYGWGRETFLRALCQKAGLPDDAWPGRARLYAFTTESFTD